MPYCCEVWMEAEEREEEGRKEAEEEDDGDAALLSSHLSLSLSLSPSVKKLRLPGDEREKLQQQHCFVDVYKEGKGKPGTPVIQQPTQGSHAEGGEERKIDRKAGERHEVLLQRSIMGKKKEESPPRRHPSLEGRRRRRVGSSEVKWTLNWTLGKKEEGRGRREEREKFSCTPHSVQVLKPTGSAATSIFLSPDCRLFPIHSKPASSLLSLSLSLSVRLHHVISYDDLNVIFPCDSLSSSTLLQSSGISSWSLNCIHHLVIQLRSLISIDYRSHSDQHSWSSSVKQVSHCVLAAKFSHPIEAWIIIIIIKPGPESINPKVLLTEIIIKSLLLSDVSWIQFNWIRGFSWFQVRFNWRRLFHLFSKMGKHSIALCTDLTTRLTIYSSFSSSVSWSLCSFKLRKLIPSGPTLGKGWIWYRLCWNQG